MDFFATAFSGSYTDLSALASAVRYGSLEEYSSLGIDNHNSEYTPMSHVYIEEPMIPTEEALSQSRAGNVVKKPFSIPNDHLPLFPPVLPAAPTPPDNIGIEKVSPLTRGGGEEPRDHGSNSFASKYSSLKSEDGEGRSSISPAAPTVPNVSETERNNTDPEVYSSHPYGAVDPPLASFLWSYPETSSTDLNDAISSVYPNAPAIQPPFQIGLTNIAQLASTGVRSLFPHFPAEDEASSTHEDAPDSPGIASGIPEVPFVPRVRGENHDSVPQPDSSYEPLLAAVLWAWVGTSSMHPEDVSSTVSPTAPETVTESNGVSVGTAASVARWARRDLGETFLDSASGPAISEADPLPRNFETEGDEWDMISENSACLVEEPQALRPVHGGKHDPAFGTGIVASTERNGSGSISENDFCSDAGLQTIHSGLVEKQGGESGKEDVLYFDTWSNEGRADVPNSVRNIMRREESCDQMFHQTNVLEALSSNRSEGQRRKVRKVQKLWSISRRAVQTFTSTITSCFSACAHV